MLGKPVPGNLVSVKGRGRGTVERDHGNGYSVVLDNGYSVFATCDDVELLEKAPTSFRPRLTSARPPEEGARRALEALRFGVVPDAALQDVTLKYDAWAQWIEGRLPPDFDDRPTVSELVGPYGTGKSHAVALVRYLASRGNYLTARVEVDGKLVTLADPASFLWALWRSLRLPSGDPIELIDLYVLAQQRTDDVPNVVPRGRDRIRRNYEIIRKIRQNRRFIHCRHAVNSILSSSKEFTASDVQKLLRRSGGLSVSDSAIDSLVGSKLCDRPYDFLESLIGHTCIAQMAGYSGLVVTIDEFEVESAALSSEKWEREKVLLRVLKSYLKDELDHPPVALGLFFATASEGSRGEDIVEELIDECSGEYRLLETWTDAEFRELAQRIFQLYQRAYGFDSSLEPKCLTRALESTTDRENRIREFIRRFLFVLDATYGPPNATISNQ